MQRPLKFTQRQATTRLIFRLLVPALILSATAVRPVCGESPQVPGRYMGREIATTMHYSGAEWLTRESRQREEDCKRLLEELHVKPGQVICDMGCGNGFYTLKLARLAGKSGKVYAVDIQQQMLDMLNERTKAAKLKNVVPLLGTETDPRLPEDSLDLVLMVDVYHEFSRPETMLKAIRKSLKPTGRIALAEFRGEDPNVPILPEHKMSKRQILKEFSANGLKLASQFDKLPWQHLMFFVRDEGQKAAAKPRAIVGAYYFDGWSGGTDQQHLTKLLTTEFVDRRPVWGWKDDTLEVMRKQIDCCADHGIAFWAFDWYYPEGKDKTTTLNNALELYLKSPNSKRLQFCLLVANHEGFRIGPSDWDACCDRWIALFKRPTHLRLDGQPLLIILSPGDLQQAFGGVDGVRKALDSLRAKAKKAGLPGVAVGACTVPGKHLADLARSGYTLLTGYNHVLGYMNGGGAKPFRKLIEGNQRILDEFAKQAPLPYLPVITAGWDRRPWEQDQLPPEKMSVWYPDRTPALVEEYVRLGVRWMDEHSDKTTAQRLLLIYAWNENGEGGYLTPTVKDGTEYLQAVQRAIGGDR